MGFAVVVGTLDISNTPIILQRNVIFGGIFIEMQQDATIRKKLTVKTLRVNGFLQKYQQYVWYQYDISLLHHSPVGPFQLGTTLRKKLKYPNMIEKKQWKALEKEVWNNGINTSDDKEVVPLGR